MLQEPVARAACSPACSRSRSSWRSCRGALNQLLDAVAENSCESEVDAIDEKLLMEGLQKIANRITLGLVIAAMIVGAALLMRVETRFRILGYPGLAILFFLAAGIAGRLAGRQHDDPRHARGEGAVAREGAEEERRPNRPGSVAPAHAHFHEEDYGSDCRIGRKQELLACVVRGALSSMDRMRQRSIAPARMISIATRRAPERRKRARHR